MQFPSIVNVLAAAVEANGDSASFRAPAPSRIEARIAGTGVVSASVTLYGRVHPDAEWEAIGSALALSGTNKASKTATIEFPYFDYKITVASLSGTGAAVNVAVCA